MVMLPEGVYLERRKTPRLASVRVRGGIPAALWACAAYVCGSFFFGRPDWAAPYVDEFHWHLAARALAVFAFAGFLPALLRRDALLEGDLGYRPWSAREVALGLASAVAIWQIREPMFLLVEGLYPGAQSNVSSIEAMRGVALWTLPGYSVAAISVALAGLLEEVFYRGFLIGAMRARFARGPWATAFYVLVSSVVFAGGHQLGHPAYYAVYAATGALFGIFFAVSRSLNVVIVAHAALNVIYVSAAAF